MPKLHMTDVVVSRLKECGTFYDLSTPAFGLRVGKTRKTWFVVRGHERLRTNIGQYPSTSLADARKEARKLLTEEPTKADRMTFDAAYELFKEALKTKKERTQYDYKRVLDNYLQPKLGSWKLEKISYEGHHQTRQSAGPRRKAEHASSRADLLSLVRATTKKVPKTLTARRSGSS